MREKERGRQRRRDGIIREKKNRYEEKRLDENETNKEKTKRDKVSHKV